MGYLRSVMVQCLLSTTLLFTPRASGDSAASSCRTTKVAVLGAGTAGISAAVRLNIWHNGWPLALTFDQQALSDGGVGDFLIVEYNSEIGGRCRHASFGQDENGKPYTVELGANWIQGTVSPGGPPNPILALCQKYGVKNQFSNFSSILTYDETGPVDYLDKVDMFGTAYDIVEEQAGHTLVQNSQDTSFRAALREAGWNPNNDAQKQAVEWYEMDFEYAQTPDVSSALFTIVNYNTTYYGFSEANNFVIDPRGYNAFLYGQASEFLAQNDPRLLLDTIVTDMAYTENTTKITTKEGGCIEADYAIVTFSVGVLQSGDVKFHPKLPQWKKDAISAFEMGTYTKIFFQFPANQTFWDKSTQYFLYASKTRGYYPLWQNLDSAGFLPGSGIFFVTVVTDQSYPVEMQDDETTKAQILVTLRQMFGADNVPEPIAFMYPRWTSTPWAYGSYSNWPPAMTLEKHQNLRANTGRVWYAGEATSSEFYGFLHGAYFEGQKVGSTIASCLTGLTRDVCKEENHYLALKGTTVFDAYSADNGWYNTSFQTISDVGLVGGGG